MIKSPKQMDNADLVWLIAAMVAANDREGSAPEGEVFRVDVPDHGKFFNLAVRALEFVVKMHRQHLDDWDGVVWFERFNDADEGSLADLLVDLVAAGQEENEDALKVVVVEWMTESGL